MTKTPHGRSEDWRAESRGATTRAVGKGRQCDDGYWTDEWLFNKYLRYLRRCNPQIRTKDRCFTPKISAYKGGFPRKFMPHTSNRRFCRGDMRCWLFYNCRNGIRRLLAFSSMSLRNDVYITDAFRFRRWACGFFAPFHTASRCPGLRPLGLGYSRVDCSITDPFAEGGDGRVRVDSKCPFARDYRRGLEPEPGPSDSPCDDCATEPGFAAQGR